MANDASRTAALLAGDVDVIDQVPSNDLARMKREPRVTVSEIQGLRLIYLVPDYSRGEGTPPVFVSDNDGRAPPPQPLRRRARAPRHVDRHQPRGAWPTG